MDEKTEIINNLISICEEKIFYSKLHSDNKIEIYQSILKILKIPNFYEKQDIEVTFNIFRDLDIDSEMMFEYIKILLN